MTMQKTLFDNGNFQLERDPDGSVWLCFGQEYSFDKGDLVEFVRYLLKEKVITLGPTSALVMPGNQDLVT